ncbi:unnamed protein product [Cuscuta campestris]|uniref:FBD domain-containing protein n=1 Tax=Cuscuta campestris TaxID=132261 RepID=A0A484M2Z4_9ASTE|nr:unnamed protein product [Cuscuta campestris]
MQSVESAQIDIYRLYEADRDIVVPRGFKLLLVVANVKTLTLTHHFLKDLAAGDELLNTLPMFCNMTDLSVEGSLDLMSFRILSMILRSPRLRNLSFWEESDHFPRHERDGLLDPVPSCFKTELKQIVLKIDHTNRERPLFLDFVGRAFALSDGSSLKTFSLSCDNLEDAPLIIEWVSFAFMHNVQVLNLYLEKPGSPYDTYVLDFFIRSESLKELSLDLPCVIVIPSWVSFPNLKKLSVSEIIFVDFNSIEKLFSCSSLDSLSIYRCKWRNLNNICISAPNLQFLDIDETINDDDINFYEVGFTFQDALSYDRRVYINRASLKTFMYNGELINDFCILGDTTKLVERA